MRPRAPDMAAVAGRTRRPSPLVPMLLVLVLAAACGGGPSATGPPGPGGSTGTAGSDVTADGDATIRSGDPADPAEVPPPGEVADPNAIDVLVDRDRSLPASHVPPDLVEAPIDWAVNDDPERRLLRAEAAQHLVELFAAAEADELPLLGVSGYRSFATQQEVHERSLESEDDGSGRFYSAEPGHSEHQTGLAVDVSGADGRCILEPCFGLTHEARWLVDNAHRFGFVVRYPADRELVTGYAHEPWHLRYLGVDLATRLHASDLTLDEHAGTAPPAVTD